MKSLEELLSSPSIVTHEIESTPTVQSTSLEPSQPPPHLYTDPQVVGYNDTQIQLDMYNFAIDKVIPITGDVSILDIGSGRGELLTHIQKYIPTLNVTEYIGVESNELISGIANELLTENDNASVVNIDFTDTDFIPNVVDHIFLIGSLNINYGYGVGKWVYIEQMLVKALSFANDTVTFILLHDTDGNDQYISFPIPNITELVLKLQLPFIIDYGEIPNIYKITIKKQSIYLTN